MLLWAVTDQLSDTTQGADVLNAMAATPCIEDEQHLMFIVSWPCAYFQSPCRHFFSMLVQCQTFVVVSVGVIFFLGASF